MYRHETVEHDAAVFSWPGRADPQASIQLIPPISHLFCVGDGPCYTLFKPYPLKTAAPY